MLLNFLSSFFKAFSLVSSLSLSNGLLLLPPGVLAPSLLIGESINCAAAAAVFFVPVTAVSYFYTTPKIEIITLKTNKKDIHVQSLRSLGLMVFAARPPVFGSHFRLKIMPFDSLGSQ